MIIQSGEVSLYVEVNEALLDEYLNPVIFLHGFTGSSADWQFIYDKLPPRFLPVAVDLIGHGKSSAPDDAKFYSVESITRQLDCIMDALKFKEAIFCGYSMGGRAALSYYSFCPEKVMGLILESTTPGIKELQFRNERVRSDKVLIKILESDGMDKFVTHWLNQPLFESLKELSAERYKDLEQRKRDNNPIGLINCLLGFGTGNMPNLWWELEEIGIPVLLVTGEMDKKYYEINERMHEKIASSAHFQIPGCGHNVHLEKPEEFINLVNKYLLDNYS